MLEIAVASREVEVDLSKVVDNVDGPASSEVEVIAVIVHVHKWSDGEHVGNERMSSADGRHTYKYSVETQQSPGQMMGIPSPQRTNTAPAGAQWQQQR